MWQKCHTAELYNIKPLSSTIDQISPQQQPRRPTARSPADSSPRPTVSSRPFSPPTAPNKTSPPAIAAPQPNARCPIHPRRPQNPDARENLVPRRPVCAKLASALPMASTRVATLRPSLASPRKREAKASGRAPRARVCVSQAKARVAERQRARFCCIANRILFAFGFKIAKDSRGAREVLQIQANEHLLRRSRIPFHSRKAIVLKTL